jgi:GR25 family glycosyltransferase involved in LPS biosynthesis
MSTPIAAYIIKSKHESARNTQVEMLQKKISDSKIVEAIFPKFQHVPFLDRMIQLSKIRFGTELLSNEIGVVMSHRKAWQNIVVDNDINSNQHYLILESDSKIINLEILKQQIDKIKLNYDLFFWGAWTGHASIKKSTKTRIDGKYSIGEPLLNSIYGAYGYSLTPQTAKYLLSKTNKIRCQIDIFKEYIDPNKVRIGTIVPEVITFWGDTESTIRDPENFYQIYKRKLIIKFFYCRNTIVSYFC